MSERGARRKDWRLNAILIASALSLLIIWALMVFGQFISRGVHFREHRYNAVDNTVTGRIAGAENPGMYGVALFIKMDEDSEEYRLMTDGDIAISKVNSDGTFVIKAYSAEYPDAKNAAYYSVFLLPAGLNVQGVTDEDETLWSTLSNEYAIDAVLDVKTGIDRN